MAAVEITIRVLGGPVEKREYRFREFPITIGRRLDNDISISDPSVSRYHCQIVRLGGSIRIVDLGSQNGIRVNDRIVQQEELADGDLISVGGASLRVHTGAAERPKPVGEPTRIDTELSGMDTVSVDPAESQYLQAQPSRGASRSERDLWTLLSVCRAVGERSTPEEAQIQLIDKLFDAIPAERGAIALCEQAGAPPVSVMTRSRLRGADKFEVSRGVLQQVLSENRSFLRTRMQDHVEDLPRTMVADRVQAALAVPLMVGGRTIGVLYLDTRRPDSPFDREHLDLATAAAATAAASIESLRRQELLRTRAHLVEAQSREDAELLLLGDSPVAADLRQLAQRRAIEDRPLLLCGPAGSEGIRLARWIHLHGGRRESPFVRLRSDASDPETLQRELFGEDDSSPGIRRLPLLEAAFGGTVVIQALQGMHPDYEPRLIRLLETGAIERRAGAEQVPVNVRLILLWEGESDRAILKKRLGEKLLRALGEPVWIPALDDRAGDIPTIASRIAEQAALDAGRPATALSPAVAAVLKRSLWPGNITQLRGAVERAEAERTSAAIEVDDLPSEVLESGPARVGGYHQRVFEARRKILLDALERTNGNFSEASEMLEINRTYLHRLIRNLEMKDDITQRFD